jgi:hypothetical protein
LRSSSLWLGLAIAAAIDFADGAEFSGAAVGLPDAPVSGMAEFTEGALSAGEGGGLVFEIVEVVALCSCDGIGSARDAVAANVIATARQTIARIFDVLMVRSYTKSSS